MMKDVCEKCKELNEKFGSVEHEAICWDCHDKRVDEYEKSKKKKSKGEIK